MEFIIKQLVSWLTLYLSMVMLSWFNVMPTLSIWYALWVILMYLPAVLLILLAIVVVMFIIVVPIAVIKGKKIMEAINMALTDILEVFD